MKSRVYIDNSVVSYLTAKPKRDAVAAGRQIVTYEWWSTASAKYEFVISDFVLEEAGADDPSAANLRLAALSDLPSVDIESADIEALADALIAGDALPTGARFDALHIAAAACNGIEFLITWNYKHLANPEKLAFVEQVCGALGCQTPRIVTPDQMLGAMEPNNQGKSHDE